MKRKRENAEFRASRSWLWERREVEKVNNLAVHNGWQMRRKSRAGDAMENGEDER